MLQTHGEDMTDIAKRPECWAFAMDFLGEPESVEVDAYACALEAEVGLLRANLASIQGHYLDLCRENRPSVALHEAALAEKDREIERLRQCLRHQDDRIGTHSAECYKFGPQHYECALAEIERLRATCTMAAQTTDS